MQFENIWKRKPKTRAGKLENYAKLWEDFVVYNIARR